MSDFHKMGIALLSFCLLVPAIVAAESKAGTTTNACLTPFNRQIVDAHEQRYGMSCIPMSVEMVLKLLKKAPSSYYELQTPWKEKADGNFKDFDGRTINGVTFHKQFGKDRNGQFPLAKLFETIDHELKTGRFVIASLASGTGWHMWVIYDEDADGDFLAVSKNGKNTMETNHVKKIITDMRGTDILTYEMAASPK